MCKHLFAIIEMFFEFFRFFEKGGKRLLNQDITKFFEEDILGMRL
jgi:hypothetical protein